MTREELRDKLIDAANAHLEDGGQCGLSDESDLSHWEDDQLICPPGECTYCDMARASNALVKHEDWLLRMSGK